MASHRPMLNSDPPESLGDADLLTSLLAAAKVKQPRATANALLAEYGSFAEALGGATGMQEQATAYLATVRAAALRLLHGKLKDRPALSSWPAVLDYLRAVMAFEPREQFRVLFLGQTQPPDRRRTAPARHHRPYAGLPAGSSQARSRVGGERNRTRSQPPVRRSDPITRRCRNDQGDHQRVPSVGHCCA